MNDMKLHERILHILKDNLLFIITVIIVFLIFTIQIPYEVEMPGGTINLNNRVTIDGNDINVEGSYNMSYVATVNGSIPYILIGLINPDWEVVKTSEYVKDNESIEDYYNRNRIYLEQSKVFAEMSAYKAAGIEFKTTKQHNKIVYLTEESNSDLKIQDEIVKFGDIEEELTSDKIIEYIDSKQPGDEIDIVVERDNKEINCKAKVYEEDGENKIGMVVAIYYDIESDYNVDIKSKGSESGPSGGFMMSLMIYSGLTGKDLTHGKKIVGTGTINSEGKVGEIGGIKYKIMGAVKDKADIFLVPEDNYEEAKNFVDKKNYDIILVSVSKLEDAINYLEGLDE